MNILELIIENREVMKLFYGAAITLICLIIVLRTDKLFRLSFHEGIRYFRNAFFFYGLGFFFRYLFELLFPISFSFSAFLFEFFIVMAGFFLLYSLVWKTIEGSQKEVRSSLFNSRIFLFYFMALVITLLDYLWMTFLFMFASQILTFIFSSVISYSNYKNRSSRNTFSKFYFIAMFLTLIIWVLNAVASLLFHWHEGILINVYAVNFIIFLIFLWGVLEVTRRT
ncbi:MAG: hypothetical protein AABX30_02950 [Nanoarchaeota archaeon]